MKSLARSTICALYKYTGVQRLQERLQRWQGTRFIAVLLFHRVTDVVPPDGLTVGTDYFRQLCRLLQARYNVISLAETYRLLKEGIEFPQRTVAITFDDCYRDNLFAARILAEHRLPACFFVPTAFIGTDHHFVWDQHLPFMPNLTWDDLAEMVALGHEIGSHTRSHPNMMEVTLEEARDELAESKKMLENRLGGSVKWFAYPYGSPGHFRPEQLPLAYEVGYEGVLSARSGLVYPDMAGQILPRIPVPSFPDLRHLDLYMSGCLEWWYRRRGSNGKRA